MPHASWLAAALLIIAAQAATKSHTVFTSENVRFPMSGDVLVTATVKQGELPRLAFRSQPDGRVLLQTNVGNGLYWKAPIDKAQPEWVAETLGFVVLHRQGLPDPLVAALGMSPGGSDCRYRVALFGEIQGHVTELTPELGDHLTRGGDLLAQDANGNWKLTVYSERYQANDVHVNGPSRMAVFVYTFDTSLGKFVETSHRDTPYGDLSDSDPNLVRLFGDLAQC